jgi:hypothetical protein
MPDGPKTRFQRPRAANVSGDRAKLTGKPDHDRTPHVRVTNPPSERCEDCGQSLAGPPQLPAPTRDLPDVPRQATH